MSFVETGSAKIHYAIEGTDGAPVLAFSNSLGTNYSMWDLQAQELRKTFRILRYDTRGHGQSAVLPGAYTIEQLGNDFLGLLDGLRLGPVHFCGLSMGGMIGMWLGIHAPSRLHKLVLSNTGAKIGTEESWRSRIEAVQKGGMKSIASGVIERWFTPALRAKAPATVAQIQRMLEESNPDGYAACCAAVRDYDCRGQLERIGAQTLIITGAHDPATPPADGQFLAAHIRGAKFAELDAAHLSNIEDGARFTREPRGIFELLGRVRWGQLDAAVRQLWRLDEESAG
jgi:3-oxoadipate enol-lactonase